MRVVTICQVGLIYLLFFFNMSIWTSLYVPRLILRTLKLTIMEAFSSPERIQTRDY